MLIGLKQKLKERVKVDNLIAEGIAVKRDLSNYPCWQNVKWCCCIDINGIIQFCKFNAP